MSGLNRREALLAAGLGVAFGVRGLVHPRDAAAATSCVLQREVTEGPFYAARGQSDTSNRADMIYRQAGSRALLDLRRKGSKVSTGYTGYTGSLVVGVSPSGGR